MNQDQKHIIRALVAYKQMPQLQFIFL
uniref:Uncharacterized protein n=2 Tax=Anguilla anguilla TaxID=7936 RepID=A0A0E9QR73_ANGAN